MVASCTMITGGSAGDGAGGGRGATCGGGVAAVQAGLAGASGLGFEVDDTQLLSAILDVTALRLESLDDFGGHVEVRDVHALHGLV